ncbi:MAG: ArsR family transcriptional regulator [Phycisphaeraceae bacterium]|nr:ArsR family transcriptional regulator [Phycisphaeraceae bacterium]
MVTPPAASSVPLIAQMESISDPARLRLLWLIERHELGVAELCDILQLPQSTVSRHLKLLSAQGWTVRRRNGTANLYRMAVDELGEAARKLWAMARTQIAASPAVSQDRIRLDRALQRRREGAARFFADAAGDWDDLRSRLYGDAFTHTALRALLPPAWRIADLGCGTGAVAHALAPHVRAVIGVDQSAEMLDAAQRRNADFDNVDLRHGDLERVPIDDRTVDAAMLVIVLTYLEDPSDALAEARRITVPGGRLVVVDLLHHDRDEFRREMGQHWPGFEPAEMRDRIAQAGWSDANCRPLEAEPNAKGPALLLADATRPANDPPA